MSVVLTTIAYLYGLVTGLLAGSALVFYYGFGMKVACMGDKCMAIWWW